jgi:acid phosphatase family membrane protein YuiD
MCAVCGLPSTHTTSVATLSTAILLWSGIVTIVWAYMIMTSQIVRQTIRRVLDHLLPPDNESDEITQK